MLPTWGKKMPLIIVEDRLAPTKRRHHLWVVLVVDRELPEAMLLQHAFAF